MSNLLRSLVSKKKKRFKEDGFDLDLTYIEPNIIAMGYPCQNYEKIFRNSMVDVKKFLEKRHPGGYKLWNLCAERKHMYDYSYFNDMVEDNFTFYDHEAPEWNTIIPFCQNVDEWLEKDKKNVAIIHCKAGKGRTGTFIASYMLYSKLFKTAPESLKHYAEERTLNKKGVTIPSQKRYVYYLDKYLSNNNKTPYKNQKLKLKSVKLEPAPLFKSDGIMFEIQDFGKNVVLDSKVLSYTPGVGCLDFQMDKDNCLKGDYKLLVKSKKGKSKEKIFALWFNSEFCDTKVEFTKEELDKGYKDCKKHHLYDKDFKVTLNFESLEIEKEDDGDDKKIEQISIEK